MSSHADTIRAFLDELRRINAEIGASAAKQFMWKNRKLVVEGLAENRRLREALERIEKVKCEFGYTGDERDSCACPACETLVIAREALAGDTE